MQGVSKGQEPPPETASNTADEKPMPALLLLLGLPIAEIALFILVGEEFGVSVVLLWILASAMIGVALISSQGQQGMNQARETVQQRQEPLAEAMTVLCTVIGGLLLIVPGFITDAIGLALAMPGLRRLTGNWLHEVLKSRAVNPGGAANYSSGPYQAGPQGHQGPFPGQSHHSSGRPAGPPPVIEGEYTVEDEDTPAPRS
jgi:UPF0716 protein FxsA